MNKPKRIANSTDEDKGWTRHPLTVLVVGAIIHLFSSHYFRTLLLTETSLTPLGERKLEKF